jgi:hypothetical protein
MKPALVFGRSLEPPSVEDLCQINRINRQVTDGTHTIETGTESFRFRRTVEKRRSLSPETSCEQLIVREGKRCVMSLIRV